MSSQKPKKKSRGAQHQPQQHHQSLNHNAQYHYPDYANRTNEDLNLAVIRAYIPDIATIISISPYVVVYEFNPAVQSWEKTETEGPLFICSRYPGEGEYNRERYAVIVMNRKALENFIGGLNSTEDMDFQDGFIILRLDELDDKGEAQKKVYGLWIHSTDIQAGPEIQVDADQAGSQASNYATMLECAQRAENAKAVMLESGNTTMASNRDIIDPVSATSKTGQQLSVQDLFSASRLGSSPAQMSMSVAPPIHAPTAVHGYSTTTGVHDAAAQLAAQQNQLQQQQQIQNQILHNQQQVLNLPSMRHLQAMQQHPALQAQTQQLLSLFQQQPVLTPQQHEQVYGVPGFDPPHSMPGMFSQQQDVGFHGPAGLAQQHQMQIQQAQMMQQYGIPPHLHNGMQLDPSMSNFGGGMTMDDLFRQAQQPMG